MRILVVSNCATSAYATILDHAFPDDEVRGAMVHRVAAWVAENNSAFLDYARSADVLVGTKSPPLMEHLRADAVVVPIPSFTFQGHHVDQFNLSIDGTDVPSPLKSGNTHSTIVAAGYAAGLSEADLAARFNEVADAIAQEYDYDAERARVIANFTAAGCPIGPAFERWEASAPFLYTFNHPHVRVFSDIVWSGIERIGQPEPGIAAMPEGMADNLASGIIWPVYPPVAARHGFAGSTTFRKALIHSPSDMDLADFIAASYALYRARDGAAAALAAHRRVAPVLPLLDRS